MPENGKMCIWYRGQNVKTVQRRNYVSSLFKCLLVSLQWSGGLVSFITKYSWEATWSQVASCRSQSWPRDVKRSLAVSIFSLFAFPWLAWPTPGLGGSLCSHHFPREICMSAVLCVLGRLQAAEGHCNWRPQGITGSCPWARWLLMCLSPRKWPGHHWQSGPSFGLTFLLTLIPVHTFHSHFL